MKNGRLITNLWCNKHLISYHGSREVTNWISYSICRLKKIFQTCKITTRGGKCFQMLHHSKFFPSSAVPLSLMERYIKMKKKKKYFVIYFFLPLTRWVQEMWRDMMMIKINESVWEPLNEAENALHKII